MGSLISTTTPIELRASTVLYLLTSGLDWYGMYRGVRKYLQISPCKQ
jgi:hypothetical protein